MFCVWLAGQTNVQRWTLSPCRTVGRWHVRMVMAKTTWPRITGQDDAWYCGTQEPPAVTNRASSQALWAVLRGLDRCIPQFPTRSCGTCQLPPLAKKEHATLIKVTKIYTFKSFWRRNFGASAQPRFFICVEEWLEILLHKLNSIRNYFELWKLHKNLFYTVLGFREGIVIQINFWNLVVKRASNQALKILQLISSIFV